MHRVVAVSDSILGHKVDLLRAFQTVVSLRPLKISVVGDWLVVSTRGRSLVNALIEVLVEPVRVVQVFIRSLVNAQVEVPSMWSNVEDPSVGIGIRDIVHHIEVVIYFLIQI